ncbi:MAG TPA: hypothetical protein VKZ46_06225, partial [Pedomonas sp.]|nr:hypothetical protein [Pedomonas sp.]
MGRLDPDAAEIPTLLMVPPLRSARKQADAGANAPEANAPEAGNSGQDGNSGQGGAGNRASRPAGAHASLFFHTDRGGRITEANEVFRRLNLTCGGSEVDVAIPGLDMAV